MDHAPQVPADERVARLLGHADLPAEAKDALLEVLQAASAAAGQAGRELSAEFGREHVGLIVGCNQFVRLWRSGREPGAVELWLDEAGKQALRAAGYELLEPEGAVFRLFGWVRVRPRPHDAALQDATKAAFMRAAAGAK